MLPESVFGIRWPGRHVPLRRSRKGRRFLCWKNWTPGRNTKRGKAKWNSDRALIFITERLSRLWEAACWIKETKQMKILFRYMTEAFMVNYTESTVYPEAISSYWIPKAQSIMMRMSGRHWRHCVNFREVFRLEAASLMRTHPFLSNRGHPMWSSLPLYFSQVWSGLRDWKSFRILWGGSIWYWISAAGRGTESIISLQTVGRNLQTPFLQKSD